MVGERLVLFVGMGLGWWLVGLVSWFIGCGVVGGCGFLVDGGGLVFLCC